jgi:hypothetical protein
MNAARAMFGQDTLKSKPPYKGGLQKTNNYLNV